MPSNYTEDCSTSTSMRDLFSTRDLAMASISRNRRWRWCRRTLTGSAITFGTSRFLKTPRCMAAANWKRHIDSGKAREPAQNTLDRGFVRRTDDAAAREARLNEHRLLLGELPKPELAMIVALSGCPDAAEGQAFLRDVQQGIVDRHAPGYRAGEDLITRRRIPAEPIKRQRPLMPVYIRQRLCQRVVGNNRQDGTEDLFIHDSHAVGYIEQQGWRQLPCGGGHRRIQGFDLNDGCAARACILDEFAQTAQMAFADDCGIVRI